MKSSDLVALLILVIVGGVAYKVYTEFGRKMPPDSPQVNEDAYGRLEMSMGEKDVEVLLGLPHQVAHGRVVAAEARYAPDIHRGHRPTEGFARRAEHLRGPKQRADPGPVLERRQGRGGGVRDRSVARPVQGASPHGVENGVPLGAASLPERAGGGGDRPVSATAATQTAGRGTNAKRAGVPTGRLSDAVIRSTAVARTEPPGNFPPSAKASAEGAAYRPADAPKFTLALPSGAVLSNTMMDVPENWQASNLPHSVIWRKHV